MPSLFSVSIHPGPEGVSSDGPSHKQSKLENGLPTRLQTCCSGCACTTTHGRKRKKEMRDDLLPRPRSSTAAHRDHAGLREVATCVSGLDLGAAVSVFRHGASSLRCAGSTFREGALLVSH